MKKLNISKPYLYQKYIVEEKSSTEIASECHCNYMTILNKLKEFNIPRRKDGIKYPFITKELLIQEYLNNNKGTMLLAKEFNCSQSVIIRRLKKFEIPARQPDKFIDLSKQKFGEWTVLERANTKETTFICRCSCNKEYPVTRSNLISGTSTCCRYCARIKHTRDKHHSWKGHEGMSGTYWNRVLSSARKRQVEITITIKEAWELFLNQKKKCALTGEKIYFPKTCKSVCTASLDRIDSSIGYIAGNIQWVHKDVNKIKSDLKQGSFIEICKKVTFYHTT